MKIEIERQDPGPEHRLLNPGEKIQAGDEFYSKDRRWVPSSVVNCLFPDPFSVCPTYRRKFLPAIEPGEGYRLLDDTEVVQKGDSFLTPDGVWLAAASIGETAGKLKAAIGCVAYRRKVETPTMLKDATAKQLVDEIARRMAQ